VIAIENTRLFTELQTRNRDLTEALEQQTATSDILRVISRSQSDVQPVFETIAANARKLCDATSAWVVTFDGELMRIAAADSVSPAVLDALRQLYPLQPSRGTTPGRAILTRATVHIADFHADPEYTLTSWADAIGIRSGVTVPMLRDGKPVGAIIVVGVRPGMFSDRQIGVLQTFADQAMIAIENTRLFNALQTRNRDLTESLEQQTATSEILRVISSSPTDLQPVLATIAESAARLCAASDADLLRVEDDCYISAAHYGPIPTISRGERLPMRRDLAPGRAIADRCIVHVTDVLAESEAEFGSAKALAARFGYRTILAAPMLREGKAIGAIHLRRTEVRPFSDRQIKLLKTFADQAVIAIENTRLFNELETRNRDLTESLEQQTATAEILRVISQSQRDVQPVFETIAANARKLCGATFGAVFTYDGELIKVAAADSVDQAGREAMDRTFPMRASRGYAIGRAVLSGTVAYIPDVGLDAEYSLQHVAQAIGFRSSLSVPMLREGTPIGVIAVSGARPAMFSERQIAMVQTFADQAVIAIENTRLFNELQTRNRDLTESLEQQTATSEILRVISQSQRDVQPVFDAIAANARKLCESTFAAVYTFDGVLIRFAAGDGFNAPALDAIRQRYPVPPDNEGGAGARAVLTQKVVHIPDVTQDPEYRLHKLANLAGFRSVVAVPMLRQGETMGTVNVAGVRPHMFSERQIAMLQTFADQAVIAIENTRLFNELQTRNRDLTESLEQQTATSEILRVISQSQRDVQPVFDAIAANAKELCGATHGWVFTFDGEHIHWAAARGPVNDLEAFRKRYPMPLSREGSVGRAILSRDVAYIPDIRIDQEYVFRDIAHTEYCCAVSVPMLREGKPIGTITLTGAEPAMFTGRQIAMLQTFADQAVIAIENTRLFTELQTRNRDLTQSLEQQTATAEILRAISSSPTDLQPVLDAVVASAARLCNANDATIFRVDGEAFRTAAHFGAIPVTPVDERLPITRNVVTGRVILDHHVLHIADVLAEPDSEFAGSKAYAVRLGYRTFLAAPLLREGTAIGAIAIRRTEV
jgi:GAF domain-containing protein